MNVTSPTSARAGRVSALTQRWQALSAREQRLLRWASGLLAAALLWSLALAPALRVLRTAPAQQLALDGQWQELKDLQTQARSLQQLPRMTQSEALLALQRVTRERLGPNAQVQTAGDRSTVNFKGVSAQELALWLAQLRTQARAVPLQAHWERAAGMGQGLASAAAASPGAPSWSGSVMFSLPPP